MRAPFIDHITVNVRDLEASRAFYEAALEMARGADLRFDEAETLLQYALLRARIGG